MPSEQQITMELSAERATYEIADGRSGSLGHDYQEVWWDTDWNLGPLQIFNASGSLNPLKMTLYSLLISEKGVPKLDVVPCCEKATGKHGLWDMVGQKFYWNAWKDPDGIIDPRDFESGPDVMNR